MLITLAFVVMHLQSYFCFSGMEGLKEYCEIKTVIFPVNLSPRCIYVLCFSVSYVSFPFAYPIISRNIIYATHSNYCLLNSNFDSSIIKLCSYVLMWSTVFYYYRIWSKIKLITEYFQLIYVAVEHAYIKLNFTNSELTIVYLFLQVVVKLWTVPWDKMRFYIYRQSFACVL